MMHGAEFHMYMKSKYPEFAKAFRECNKNTYAFFLTDVGIITEKKYAELLDVEKFQWVSNWTFIYFVAGIGYQVQVKSYDPITGGIYDVLQTFFDENPKLLDFYLI